MPRKPCSPSGYGSKRPGDITLKATVEWMACDEGSCLPPEERTLTFTIRGASAGQTAGVPAPRNRRGRRQSLTRMSGRRPKPEAIRQTRRRTDRLPPHRGKLSPTASRPRKRTRRPRIGQTRRKLPLPPNRTDRKAHSGLPPRLPKRPEDHCGPPSSRPCCGDWRPC